MKSVKDGIWNPCAELASLRWKADMPVVNHFGEHMWLKQMPGYITDCCFIDEPCERHSALPRPKCEISGCLHDGEAAHDAHIASGLYTEVSDA
jgi:hypothetical protein